MPRNAVRPHGYIYDDLFLCRRATHTHTHSVGGLDSRSLRSTGGLPQAHNRFWAEGKAYKPPTYTGTQSHDAAGCVPCREAEPSPVLAAAAYTHAFTHAQVARHLLNTQLVACFTPAVFRNTRQSLIPVRLLEHVLRHGDLLAAG